jgi:aminobenzoyl-glutamate utilization protein B
MDRKALEKIDRAIAGMMAVSEHGIHQLWTKARMEELERVEDGYRYTRGRRIRRCVDVHPNIANIYRTKVVAFCWHPCVYNAVMSSSTLANVQAYFRFRGRAAHAAMAPRVGRSASDAIELMNAGINYMREHMPPDARVHYAVTNMGGVSPNVVQANAEGLYLVRAPKSSDARVLFERVRTIAEGAALINETSVEMEFDRATSSVLPDRVLEMALHANFV